MKFAASFRKVKGSFARVAGSPTGFLLACFCAWASVGLADTFYARSGISDWTDYAASFTTDAEGQIPATRALAAGDEVMVPDSSSVTIADTASLKVVNTITRIRPCGTTAYVIFNVPEDAYWTNSCPVNYDGVNRTSYSHYGRLIKRGKGVLELTTADTYRVGSYNCDYCTGIIDEEGVLVLPQISGASGSMGSSLYSYSYAISNNATLFLPCGIGGQVAGFTGEKDALVTNRSATAVTFTISGQSSKGVPVVQEYAGRFGGEITLRSAARLWLTGTNTMANLDLSAFNNKGVGSTGDGIIGVRRFGKIADKGSSIGIKNYLTTGLYPVNGYSGGGIRCLATAEDGEEETDKIIQFYSNLGGADLVDAGDFGGVTFTGDWTRPTTASAYVTTRQMGMIDLWGENLVHPCVIKGPVKLTTYASVRYPFHITKRGNGIWRLADQSGTLVNNDREGVGAITIADGTLQVESIARKYDLCALGTGVDTMEAYIGARDETKRVAWNIALGSENGEGTLDYVGSEAVNAYSRPIVFRGSARLKNSSAAQVRYLALASEATGAMTVTLDGTNTDENELSDVIDDAENPISVVKEGAGKWILGGNLTFHGSITVKGGELVIRTYPAKYSWYKWIVKQSYTNEQQTTGGSILGTRCLALYDKDNQRQNGDLTVVTNGFATLQPGQATCEANRKINDYSGTRPWATIFDDYGSGYGMYLDGVVDAFGTVRKSTTATPSYWLPFVMRLRNDANEVVAWDYAVYFGRRDQGGGNYVPYRTIGCSTIEASADGLHWDNVLGGDKLIDGDQLPFANNCWVSAGDADKAFASGDAAKHTSNGAALAIPDGFKLAKTAPAAFSVLPDGVAVKVCGGRLSTDGGTVSVNRLTVDMSSSGGAVSGVSFAKTGTLVIENYVPVNSTTPLPIAFSNVSDQSNMTQWDLQFSGARQYSRHISVGSDGTVSLVPNGFFVIIK